MRGHMVTRENSQRPRGRAPTMARPLACTISFKHYSTGKGRGLHHSFADEKPRLTQVQGSAQTCHFLSETVTTRVTVAPSHST